MSTSVLSPLSQEKTPIPLEENSRAHRMPFGAEVLPDGQVRFRLWAPAADSVSLAIDGEKDQLPLQKVGGGWHELVTHQASNGTLYRFVLPDGLRVPDPASRFQPDDVRGPSEVIDPASYTWSESKWTGRPWTEAVLYELHVGTFTGEGTFLAAIGKLDHLARLGVTAVQIMPVADFAGKRNWATTAFCCMRQTPPTDGLRTSRPSSKRRTRAACR